jgi:hypothetical protein
MFMFNVQQLDLSVKEYSCPFCWSWFEIANVYSEFRGLEKVKVAHMPYQTMSMSRDAQQCFQYFPKSTATIICSSIETHPQKPHKIPVVKNVWYFDCCSPACERYTEMLDLRNCSPKPWTTTAAM